MHETDGIADLEYALKEGHRLKVDLAVKRFIRLVENLSAQPEYKQIFHGNFKQHAYNFIASLNLVKWNGNHRHGFEGHILKPGEKFRINTAEGLFRTLVGNSKYDLYEPDACQPSYTPYIDMYYGFLYDKTTQADFINKVIAFTSGLIREIISGIGGDFEYVLTDQAFPPTAPNHYMRYFSESKTILIDRDPRDLYVINKHDWGARFIPSYTVDLFIQWYKLSRISQKQVKENADVLVLPFESFIYEYENDLNKIYTFTGLSCEYHTEKLSRFNPEISIKNTQVYKKYPELAADIEKIEQELTGYCYNFPENSYPFSPHLKKHIATQDILAMVDPVQAGYAIPHIGFTKYFTFLYNMTTSGKAAYWYRKRKGIGKARSSLKCIVTAIFIPVEIVAFLVSLCVSRLIHNQEQKQRLHDKNSRLKDYHK